MDSMLEKISGLTKSEQAECAKHMMLGGGTRGSPLLVRGNGVRVYDLDGKDYVDCTSQSWAMYLGHANEEINRVVAEHMQSLSHVHRGFDTLPRFYLARKLAQLAPGDLKRISFTVGGGPAIEAAMKIAYKNTQPSRDFICLYDSYHGTTLGMMSAAWISTRASGKLAGGSRFLGLTRPFVRVPNPCCFRCPLGLKREDCSLACVQMLRLTMERAIAGNAAGIIIEPIQASGGQIILPRGYLGAVRKVCDDFNVPPVFDEIQTYARTGRFFAAEYFGVTPDIIVLGKGLGAGLPIAPSLSRTSCVGLIRMPRNYKPLQTARLLKWRPRNRSNCSRTQDWRTRAAWASTWTLVLRGCSVNSLKLATFVWQACTSASSSCGTLNPRSCSTRMARQFGRRE